MAGRLCYANLQRGVFHRRWRAGLTRATSERRWRLFICRPRRNPKRPRARNTTGAVALSSEPQISSDRPSPSPDAVWARVLQMRIEPPEAPHQGTSTERHGHDRPCPRSWFSTLRCYLRVDALRKLRLLSVHTRRRTITACLKSCPRSPCFNASIHPSRSITIVYLHRWKHLKSGHQTWPYRYLFSETTTTASATSQMIKTPPEAEMHWPDIHRASSPASQATTLATSSTVPTPCFTAVVLS